MSKAREYLHKLTIKQVIIWLTIIVIPLLYTSNLLDPVLYIRFLGLNILLICIFAILIFSKLKSNINSIDNLIYKQKIFPVYTIYIIYSLIGLFYTYNFADGVFESLQITLSGIFILLFTIFFKDYKDFNSQVSKSITILSLIIILQGVWEYFQVKNTIGITHHNLYEIRSSFANKNIFSEILFLCLPFSLFMIFNSNKYWKLSGYLSSILILFLITILITRAVWMAMFISFFLTIILLLFHYKKLIKHNLNRKLLLTFSIFIGAIIFAVYIYSKQDSFSTFQKSIGKIFTSYDSSKNRLELWKKTYKIIKENPVKGSGLGTWKIEIMKYGNSGLESEDNLTFYQRPHNDYLWILSEQGIIGLFLFLSIFIMLFIYLLAILKKTNELKDIIFYLLMFFGLTGYLIFSFFSFPKERIEHSIFIGIIISSIIIRHYQLFKLEKAIKSKFKITKYLFPIILILLLCSLFIGFSKYNSETHTRKAFEARAAENWQQVCREIDKATNTFNTFDPISTPLLWYKASANFNLGNVDQAFIDFNEAYKVNPNHIHVLNNLGTCYELKGDHTKAIELYKQALSFAPNFEDALLNLCAVQFNLGNIDSAYAILCKVNVETQNEKYQQFLKVIIDNKINTLMNKLPEDDVKSSIEVMRKDFPWLFTIHVKAMQKSIIFEKQLILDVLYIFEIDKSYSNLKYKALRNKYNSLWLLKLL